jgi:alanine racemase
LIFALAGGEIEIVQECYRCWAEVDLNALRENLVQVRSLAGPDRKVLTVVKADAYGHGLREIAAVLMQSGTDIFGVANLAEARAIRSVGKGWPILMLGACLPPEAELAVRDGVMATVSSLEEAHRFSAAAVRQRKIASVHLKIDTGMGRLGVAPSDAKTLLEQIEKLPALSVKGLCTHYAAAEDDPTFTTEQRRRFAEFVAEVSAHGRQFEWLHASNSGGLLL